MNPDLLHGLTERIVSLFINTHPCIESKRAGGLMHPFQWCNGCFCGLGLIYSNKTCTMSSVTFQDLPLNIYMVIFGTGIFVFVLSLIFCCYFIR
ncbi:hypothetical protein cypCar_00012667 [Cyprinus carpio]|nr:hypothetical protein cypCar_00012667 [Cyprinus carpio]